MGYSPDPTTNSNSRVFLTALLVIGFAHAAFVLAPGQKAFAASDVLSSKNEIAIDMARARAYLKGNGVQQDFKQAAYWYERAAGFGDPVAQNQIGYFYQTGMGVSRDLGRAVHWYQLAASAGNSFAKLNLAVAYLWGVGVQNNPELARVLLEEAAKAGNSKAKAYLGDMYYQGIGVQQDQSAGVMWYEKAAKEHDYLADYRLGAILSKTAKSTEDLNRAYSLLYESAASGFVPAMYGVGLLVANHSELDSYHDEALKDLLRSESFGMWKSSIVLGALARDGKWVPRDLGSAYLHFRMGVLQGGTVAAGIVRGDLSILSKQFTKDEIKKYDEQAQAWFEQHRTAIEYVQKIHGAGQREIEIGLAAPGENEHAGELIPILSN